MRDGSATPVGAGALGDGGCFDVALDDLEILSLLGTGVSGVVHKVRHRPTGTILALKKVQMNVEEQARKQIIQELRTLHSTFCLHIVGCRGAFYGDGAVSIVLEHMDAGSLAALAQAGPVPERVLASVAKQVLLGLRHLHGEHKVIHRDIKPSNLLVSTRGEVKVCSHVLCPLSLLRVIFDPCTAADRMGATCFVSQISDFGVAGQLGHSQAMAKSWVGTVTYMSPERIAGRPYNFDSDTWSLALCLVELALGIFPYPPGRVFHGLLHESAAACGAQAAAQQPASLGFWDLMDFIVAQPAPRLDPAAFSGEFCDFVARGLHKDAGARISVEQALAHPWLRGASEDGAVDVAPWVGNALKAAEAARKAAQSSAVARAQQAHEALDNIAAANLVQVPPGGVGAAAGDAMQVELPPPVALQRSNNTVAPQALPPRAQVDVMQQLQEHLGPPQSQPQ